MSFEYLQKMPSPEEIIAELPVDDQIKKQKSARDKELADIIMGNSDKFLVIIGPCSAHHDEAVYDYVSRLAEVQEQVKDKLFLVPRIYTNKPRTTGAGYKGMAHQPNLSQKPDIVKGVKAIRSMHIKAINESGLTPADEMLYPENYAYLIDVLSYVAVGARSVENQQHRLTISGLDVPSGMKNPTSGHLSVMLNAIKAAQMPHVFNFNGWEVHTSGNPLAHAVLRGSINSFGQSIANYHYEDLTILTNRYLESGLSNSAIIVDTNHSNSNKQYAEQPRIALEIMNNRKNSPVLYKTIKGLLIESFIEDGSQPENGNVYGQSITDPCLGWEQSKQLIFDLAELV